ncbi:hypothetical protein EJ03DRAFT_51481 [Teratosphaeria nubilosa]|uniref:Uncharacterized protein n=1 Tax=Teratosphaeria nubilosa TaxID=161662 RepID=A0A6G1LEW3_9PEZI|nr:hypothetical protein EJ03DRAFT_51481 [Teratosphaeria nubilosa]
MQLLSLLLPLFVTTTLGAACDGGIPPGPKGWPDPAANCCYEVVGGDPTTICCNCLNDLVIKGNLVYPAGTNCPADNRACGPACTWKDTCCWRMTPNAYWSADCFCYGGFCGSMQPGIASESCGHMCPPDYHPGKEP